MNAHDPFRTAKAPVTKVKTKTGCRTKLNPDDLEICDDPVPTKRVLGSQYDAIFLRMKLGQCIKVEPERVGTVSAALRNWVKRSKRKSLLVKQVTLYKGCEEQMGRIWLLEKPKASAAS